MIYLFLADGFEEIEALCPLDLLRRANFEVTTVGVGGKTIVGAHGIPVVADIADTEFDDANPTMIILPGGMPGTKNLDESPVVGKALDAALAADAPIAAICAAPMVLGKRGILRGKEVTCFPGFEGYLEGATLSPLSVVRDGNIVTAKGMGVALPFGLALVELLTDKQTAAALKDAIMAE